MPTQDPRAILIIKLGWAGDIIMALPTLRALRERLPEAHIGWVVDERFVGVIASDPRVDQLHVFPNRRWVRMLRAPATWPTLLREARAFLGDLRRLPWDVCLDLTGQTKSALLAALARPRRSLRIEKDHLSHLVRRLIRAESVPATDTHLVQGMIALAGTLGADISAPVMSYSVPEEARAWARNLIEGHDFGVCGPLVAVNPGASQAHKQWPWERFAATARALIETLGARIVVLGGPSEVELSGRVVERIGPGVLCTAGQTDYSQLAALLGLCQALVTADTGPMHAAAAVGTPCVVIIGPTCSDETGPWGSGHVILEQRLPCWRCKVPCEEHRCMKATEVQTVVEATLGLLNRPR